MMSERGKHGGGLLNLIRAILVAEILSARPARPVFDIAGFRAGGGFGFVLRRSVTGGNNGLRQRNLICAVFVAEMFAAHGACPVFNIAILRTGGGVSLVTGQAVRNPRNHGIRQLNFIIAVRVAEIPAAFRAAPVGNMPRLGAGGGLGWNAGQGVRELWHLTCLRVVAAPAPASAGFLAEFDAGRRLCLAPFVGKVVTERSAFIRLDENIVPLRGVGRSIKNYGRGISGISVCRTGRSCDRGGDSDVFPLHRSVVIVRAIVIDTGKGCRRGMMLFIPFPDRIAVNMVMNEVRIHLVFGVFRAGDLNRISRADDIYAGFPCPYDSLERVAVWLRGKGIRQRIIMTFGFRRHVVPVCVLHGNDGSVAVSRGIIPPIADMILSVCKVIIRRVKYGAIIQIDIEPRRIRKTDMLEISGQFAVEIKCRMDVKV